MRQQAEMIQRTFKELSIRLDPASRIARQIDTYLDRKDELPQIIEPTHELHATIVEAQRDLSQIAFAITQLRTIVPDEELARRLLVISQDHVLPQNSLQSSRGRDTQCETFVAALCARAGLKPIFDESPDIRCELGKDTWGVAVKRIKSPISKFEDRLQERFREATKQIVRSGLPGVIAVDISQSLNPANYWVPQEISDAQFDSLWGQRMDAIKTRFEVKFCEWARGTPVRGILFVDHMLRSLPGDKWNFELFVASLNLCRHNQRRRREFDLFDERFKAAVLNPGKVIG